MTSCRCPAKPGEDCPLAPGECAARQAKFAPPPTPWEVINPGELYLVCDPATLVVAMCRKQEHADDIARLPVLKAEVERIREAIQGYYRALDRREHGGIAQHKAFEQIEKVLGMSWTQGATL